MHLPERTPDEKDANERTRGILLVFSACMRQTASGKYEESSLNERTPKILLVFS